MRIPDSSSQPNRELSLLVKGGDEDRATSPAGAVRLDGYFEQRAGV